MKKHLIALFVIALQSAAFSQDKVALDGKQYFVYPYQQELKIPTALFRYEMGFEEIIHRDSLNRKIVSTEVQPVEKDPYDMFGSEEMKDYRKLILEIRKKAPNLLINSNFSLETDITPYLDPLPDGEYVQYYRDIPYIEGKTLRYRNNIICSRFSLKNNLLDGSAIWYTVDGDTMKFGTYSAGEKSGYWEHHGYRYNPPRVKPELEKFLDGTYKSTILTQVQYDKGLLNGEVKTFQNDTIYEIGHFKDGKQVGEWFKYGKKTVGFGMLEIETDTVIAYEHYTLVEKPIQAKGIIIRSETFETDYIDESDFNLNYSNRPYSMYEFYDLYFEKPEEGLELPGENTRSYPGEDERNEYSYLNFQEGYTDASEISFEGGSADATYYLNGKEYTRNELIDSIGYETSFDGLYEKYYPNGQLMMRFNIEKGVIQEPDTIFWDNGIPVSVIRFDEKDREFSETVKDLDGKIVFVKIYDEKGNFLRNEKEAPQNNLFKINGLDYYSEPYEQFFFYNDRKGYDTILTKPLLEYSILWKSDTLTASRGEFDPATRIKKSEEYSLDKKKVYSAEFEFNENYSVVTGQEEIKYDALKEVVKVNGSYYVDPMRPTLTEDTLLTRHVQSMYRKFDLTEERLLYVKDKLFTGTFKLDAHAPKFSCKVTEKSIVLGNGMGPAADRQKYSELVKYGKKHTSTPLTTFLTNETIESGFSVIIDELFPFLSKVRDEVSEDMFYDYEVEEEADIKILSEKKVPEFDKYVEGQFLNGKPEGKWIAKDQFGKITTEVTFVNGELEGEARYFKTEHPLSDLDMERYLKPELFYKAPQKPTHYLSFVRHFHKGIQTGAAFELNWLGDTIYFANYSDDSKNGFSFERTKIAYSRSNYENGYLNGILQTYLILPGKDSSLLYDLNFRNGALQGESKAYHLNGKLAKRGFFLAGEPIDDFEAYDTLGFKYQYVKFLYGQPVEEKIWEENELSVQYLFNWKDSIPFNAGDIAQSTSLERELHRLGVYGSDYSRPYYGRPSLLSKAGIKYEMTKYYPNNIVARHGMVNRGKKEGQWQYYSYEGVKVYDVNYFDTIITTPAGVRFKSKGILTDYDSTGNAKSRSYIVERFEKYDCAHTDHLEERMLITIWEKDSSVNRWNGFVRNYYDNGVVQNEGQMKNGVATGVWKFFDPYGSLNKVGLYLDGKRDGRWLSGDLGNLKYMGDICLNPNLENLEEIMGYQEKLLDITVTYYQKGIVRKTEYYGINANPEGPPEDREME